jgi:inner membrane protein
MQFRHPEKNMQTALIWKLSTVLALSLLALIPLAMVRGIITERQSLRDGVIRSFETETVGPQILKGPVLVIPYRKSVTETSEERDRSQGAAVEIKRRRTVDGRLYFLPDTLEIDGNASVQERRRGIYTAQAYSADWKVAGRFDLPAHLAVGPDHAQYTWGTPELGYGIGDPRGLEPGISLTLNGKHAALEAGTSVPGLGRWVHAVLDTGRAQSGAAQPLEPHPVSANGAHEYGEVCFRVATPQLFRTAAGPAPDRRRRFSCGLENFLPCQQPAQRICGML